MQVAVYSCNAWHFLGVQVSDLVKRSTCVAVAADGTAPCKPASEVSSGSVISSGPCVVGRCFDDMRVQLLKSAVCSQTNIDLNFVLHQCCLPFC